MATEKRLIDANALIEFVDTRTSKWIYKPDLFWAIEQQPTVDAVEVVRCKDCKNYVVDGLWCNSNCCVGENHANWYPDDFCSYGERKDNDGARKNRNP